MKKKHRDKYERIFKLQAASLEIDQSACEDECLKQLNADITSIVFSCAVAKGFASVDMRNIAYRYARKGWKRVVFNCGQKEWVEICSIGPIKTEGPRLLDDDYANNLRSVTYSFEWIQS